MLDKEALNQDEHRGSIVTVEEKAAIATSMACLRLCDLEGRRRSVQVMMWKVATMVVLFVVGKTAPEKTARVLVLRQQSSHPDC